MEYGVLTQVVNEGILFIAHRRVELDNGEICTGSEGINLREVFLEGASNMICTCSGVIGIG